jgi:type II secretory pathway component PulK
MKTGPLTQSRQSSGVALVIVMLVVIAMGVTAGAFAYAMKVEARLAQNTTANAELTWLGLSGVEFAKWILAQQARIPGEAGFDSLNQFWAGGPGNPDLIQNPFEGVSMKDVPIGEGRISIRIVDQERRLNINTADPLLLHQALTMIGAGASDGDTIVNAIIDWRDRDGVSQSGRPAETGDYYDRLDPPYRAKDGPLGDMGELLKVRGVTPEVYFGTDYRETSVSRRRGRTGPATALDNGQPSPGLAELFCAISGGQVNINTAPLPVLQLALGGDGAALRTAEMIIKNRSGPDGTDGTLDDEPARSPGDLPRLMGTGGPQLRRFSVNSSVFTVWVDVVYGQSKQRYRALIHRRSPRDFATLLFRKE